MKEFIILAVGLINLVLNLYTLWQVKDIDMRVGFIVKFLTKKGKGDEEK